MRKKKMQKDAKKERKRCIKRKSLLNRKLAQFDRYNMRFSPRDLSQIINNHRHIVAALFKFLKNINTSSSHHRLIIFLLTHRWLIINASATPLIDSSQSEKHRLIIDRRVVICYVLRSTQFSAVYQHWSKGNPFDFWYKLYRGSR